MAVQFSNKNSENKRLYINMEDIPCWSGYFYSGTMEMPTELSIEETWKADGRKSAYIFCRNSPGDTGDFARRLGEYLNSRRDARIYCLWIKNTEEPLEGDNTESISADAKSAGDLVDRDVHILTGNFIWLSILQNCTVSLNEEKGQIEIQRGFAGSDITFYNNSFQMKSQVGEILAVPFSGLLAGCLCFPLTVRGIPGLRDYRVKLLYRDSSLNQDYEYPIFSCAYSEKILFQASIDPLDQYNRAGTSDRTYLAFKEQQEAIPSCFRSIYGEEILLKPYAEEIYQISENSARIVFQTWEKEREETVYMVPQGDFYLWGNGCRADGGLGQNQLRLLGGLSGQEYIECTVGNEDCEGDFIRFMRNHPAEYVQGAYNSVPEDILHDGYQTAWLNVLSPEGSGRKACYISQPEDAILYGPETEQSGILAYMPCKTAVPGEDKCFPLVPYGEAEGVEADFEKNVLMLERNRKICRDISIQCERKSGISRRFTTPQGLIAEIEEDTGQWTRLLLGTNLFPGKIPEEPKTLEFLPGSGQPYLHSSLKNAFQNYSMFLVVSQKEGGILGDFHNQINIEDWLFSFHVPEKSSAGNFGNILIFKFCPGKLVELAKDTGKWTAPGIFNNADTLSLLSRWISDYIENGVENYQRNHNEDFADFAALVQDENYRGILVLKADVSISSFPEELEGLLGGMDLSRFYAYYFGVNTNRVELDENGRLEMKKNSSLFGLIHYTDIDFENMGCDTDRYRRQKRTITSLDYDFRVLSLNILFQNSKISAFGSMICLTVNKIFQAAVDTSGRDNLLILNGSMERQDGASVYSFHNAGTNSLVLQNSILSSLDIVKTQFQTISEDEKTNEIISCFSLSGYLGFEKLDFDVFSYGGEGGAEAGKGLAFSRLGVQMSFSSEDPEKKTFLLCTETMSFDSSRSSLREGSLANHFPVKFSSLLWGGSDKTPADLGYVVMDTPDLKNTGIGSGWFGLNFTLDLGTLGELAADSGFQAEILAVWQGKSGAAAIKLSGNTQESKAFSLDGVLKLEIEKIRLVQAVSREGKPAYLLMMNRICLKLLGIQFPKDAAIDFYIFGNPDNTTEHKGLSWYAAYQAEDEKEGHRNG